MFHSEQVFRIDGDDYEDLKDVLALAFKLRGKTPRSYGVVDGCLIFHSREAETLAGSRLVDELRCPCGSRLFSKEDNNFACYGCGYTCEHEPVAFQAIPQLLGDESHSLPFCSMVANAFIEQADYTHIPEPDTDGSTRHGWEVFLPETASAAFGKTIIAVRPVWTVYHK